MAQLANSLMTHHLPARLGDLRDTLRDKPLTSYVFSSDAIPVPSAGNVIAEPGRLKVFNASIIIESADNQAAVRTYIYDTSGTPTGSERDLFNVLSFATKALGNTYGLSTHNIVFPEQGLAFEHGIGFKVEALIGTATISFVDAFFGYVRPADDYPATT